MRPERPVDHQCLCAAGQCWELRSLYRANATAYQCADFECHVCGLTDPDGAIFCWGGNYLGQLGNDGHTEGSRIPVRVKEPLPEKCGRAGRS